ncbi:MAG: hypothetical protein RLZZ156_510 [Deinococcota bacterium]|jgi:hypothetical protein
MIKIEVWFEPNAGDTIRVFTFESAATQASRVFKSTTHSSTTFAFLHKRSLAY